MTDQVSLLVIGSLLSLGGVLVGGLLSFGVEFIRRRWAVSDRKYIRKREVTDRRCDQAEAYVQSMTQDFRLLLRDIDIYLRNPDPLLTEARTRARSEWMDRFDMRIFSLGPAIRAIEHDGVEESWSGLIERMEEIQKLYLKVCNSILGDGGPLDVDEEMAKATEIWLQYSAHLGDFYRDLDDARYRLTEL